MVCLRVAWSAGESVRLDRSNRSKVAKAAKIATYRFWQPWTHSWQPCQGKLATLPKNLATLPVTKPTYPKAPHPRPINIQKYTLPRPCGLEVARGDVAGLAGDEPDE